MADESQASVDPEVIEPGEPVFDRNGKLLGSVAGATEDGFEVETVDPDHPGGVDQKEIPGQEFGEGYLMWRCGECGEMGELDDNLPESCPSCGAPKEDLMYWTED